MSRYLIIRERRPPSFPPTCALTVDIRVLLKIPNPRPLSGTADQPLKKRDDEHDGSAHRSAAPTSKRCTNTNSYEALSIPVHLPNASALRYCLQDIVTVFGEGQVPAFANTTFWLPGSGSLTNKVSSFSTAASSIAATVVDTTWRFPSYPQGIFGES